MIKMYKWGKALIYQFCSAQGAVHYTSINKIVN